MDTGLIINAGKTPAALFAGTYLAESGLSVTNELSMCGQHLLLDVPSFRPDGQLRSGEDSQLLLCELPPEITLWGGNLNHPGLAGYKTIDLLKDPTYLSQNAYITAECVLDVVLPLYGGLLRDCPILIIGWGRIGKCLARILRGLDAEVTVAARKASDQAMLTALGYRAAEPSALADLLPSFRMVINTAPEPVLSREQTAICRRDCLKIELASRSGMEGDDILIARGLPGIHRPEASGRLIAQTMIRYLHKEEIL